MGGDQLQLLKFRERAAHRAAADLILLGQLVFAGQAVAAGQPAGPDQVREITDQLPLLTAHAVIHVHTCTALAVLTQGQICKWRSRR